MLIKLIRLPIDLILLTYYFIKGTLWLANVHVRELFDLAPGGDWPYGCFTEKTDTKEWACIPGAKFGNPFMFKSLCSDFRRHECHGCHCLGEMEQSFSRWHPGHVVVLKVALLLILSWSAIGGTLFIGAREFLSDQAKADIRARLSSLPWIGKIDFYATQTTQHETRNTNHATRNTEHFLDRARRLTDDGNHQEALLEYRNAFHLAQDDAEICRQIGECLIRLNRREEAVTLFKRAIELDPKNWQNHLTLARIGIESNDIDFARSHAEAATEINSDAVEAWLIVGLCNQHQGVPESIRDVLATVEKLQIENSVSFTYAGFLYSDLGNFVQAQEHYQTAIELDPENFDARIGLANLFGKQDDFDQAEAQLNTILQSVPGHLKALVGTAELNVARNNRSAAIETYRTVIDLEGSDVSHHLRLAELLAQSGKSDEAIANLQALVLVHPDEFELHNTLARYLLRHRMFESAIKHATVVLNNDPDNPQSLPILVKALLAKNEFEEATRALDKALNIDPDNLNTKMMLAAVYQRSGNGTAAEGMYRRAVEDHSDSVIPSIGLGKFYKRSGNPTAAADTFNQALQRFPDDPVMLNELAILYLDIDGKLDDACRILGQLIREYPDNVPIINAYSVALHRKGEFDQAREHLASSAKIAPANPVTHFLLGKTLLSLQEPRVAEEHLVQAMNLSSEFSGYEEARALVEELQRRRGASVSP